MTSRADAPPTNGIWAPDEDSLPYLSAAVVDRPPIKLLLSLVGRCNLRCFHCLGTSEELVRASQDSKSASRELVDFVVDRVLPDVRAIRLGGVGLTEQLTSRTFDYFMERAATHAPRIEHPVDPTPAPLVAPNDGADSLLADVEAANVALHALRERLEQRRQIEHELEACRRQLDDANTQLSNEQTKRRDLEQQLGDERERRGETTRMLAQLLQQLGS